MAKTPWEMADVGREFSHQSALFAWAAMARNFGVFIANHADAYQRPGWAMDCQRDHQIGGGNVGGHTSYIGLPIPELKWLHAIKNQGHGDRVRGAMSAAEGVRPGVFDVFLPVQRAVYKPRNPDSGWSGGGETVQYAGLYLELKRPDKNSTSPKQLEFQADMRAAGYAAEIVVGWQAARDCILQYLGKG